MNILTDNPVFQREARWGRRLRRLRHNKPLAAMVALIALAVGWLYSQGLNYYARPNDPFRLMAISGGPCMQHYLALLVLLAPIAGVLGDLRGEGSANVG